QGIKKYCVVMSKRKCAVLTRGIWRDEVHFSADVGGLSGKGERHQVELVLGGRLEALQHQGPLLTGDVVDHSVPMEESHFQRIFL
ncbi:hypothetical protein AVEN_185151-1, partial [Araneus ventricosus]